MSRQGAVVVRLENLGCGDHCADEPLISRRAMLSAPLILASLAGCSSPPPRQQAPTRPWSRTEATPQQSREASIHVMSLIGTPYRYGGNTPATGFDCSGLIGFVYHRAAGIQVPRTVREIATWGLPTGAGDVRAGDLVIFGSKGQASHAGIYVGESRFVHAPSTGGTVRIDPLGVKYWRERFMGFRRPA